MPLVFDSVFTASLARDLHARWAGCRLEALGFDREARRVDLRLGGERWVWLLHPLEGVPARLDDPSRRRDGRGLLSGPRRIVAVRSPADTRQIIVGLDGPDEADETLVIDLVTNQWNALHVTEGVVRAVLAPGLGRDPTAPGDPWKPAVSDRRWATPEAAPDAAEWMAELEELTDASGGRARRRIAWLSAANEAAVLGDVLAGDSVDRKAAEESRVRYLRLRETAVRAEPEGWLLADESGRHPYVASLDLPGAERVGSPLDALAAWAADSPRIRAALGSAAESAATTALREALEERRDRAAKKIRALRDEVETGRDPDELRQLGHLLLARKAEVPAGSDEVRLEGFDGEPRTIDLEPALDAIGNAEALYERARRLERAAAELPGRIAKAERRRAALQAALARLAESGPDEELWTLAGGRQRLLGRGAGSGQAARGRGSLPYRVFRTSSGREVRAGRSARANDDLTFHHSAPDDIWMHVREAPGSHVVLRWGDRDQNPPEADIAEAALVAAVLSQARGSTVVPVAWTRRKYVRKPRKAPPGAVVPERTQTVFVEPDARKVARMAVED